MQDFLILSRCHFSNPGLSHIFFLLKMLSSFCPSVLVSSFEFQLSCHFIKSPLLYPLITSITLNFLVLCFDSTYLFFSILSTHGHDSFNNLGYRCNCILLVFPINSLSTHLLILERSPMSPLLACTSSPVKRFT
jgi:hypothetical protein